MEQIECKHNPGIGCMDRSKCEACGWNPAVAKQRVQRVKEARAAKGRGKG